MFMKKTIALFVLLCLCISLCSCTPVSPSDTITYSDDGKEMYYNGRTYITYPNGNRKYMFSYQDGNWTEIATMPYGFFYILRAVTVYYGDDAENPDVIFESRTHEMYVREGISFDENTELAVKDMEKPFSFRISEVTTGNVIKFSLDIKKQFDELAEIYVTLGSYDYIEKRIYILRLGDDLYLQDVWKSDYYEITDEFEEELMNLGLLPS